MTISDGEYFLKVIDNLALFIWPEVVNHVCMYVLTLLASPKGVDGLIHFQSMVYYCFKFGQYHLK